MAFESAKIQLLDEFDQATVEQTMLQLATDAQHIPFHTQYVKTRRYVTTIESRQTSDIVKIVSEIIELSVN